MGDIIDFPLKKGETFIVLPDDQDNGVELIDSVTTCPKCRGQKWYIYLDELGTNFKEINGLVCCKCKFTIIF